MVDNKTSSIKTGRLLAPGYIKYLLDNENSENNQEQITENITKLCSSNIKITAWNILAHMHTTYNYRLHNNGYNNTESNEQQMIRKIRNDNIINKLNTDILLLQEYVVGEIDIPEYLVGVIEYNTSVYSTSAIFYNKNKLTLDFSIDIQLINNKNAILARFKDNTTDIYFIVVSIHLTGGKNGDICQEQELKIIDEYISNYIDKEMVIFGGDFNQENINFLNEYCNKMHFINRYHYTALIRGMSKVGCVDYFAVNSFAKNYFKHHGTYLKPKCNPWSQYSNIGSDHVPIIGELYLRK